MKNWIAPKANSVYALVIFFFFFALAYSHRFSWIENWLDKLKRSQNRRWISVYCWREAKKNRLLNPEPHVWHKTTTMHFIYNRNHATKLNTVVDLSFTITFSFFQPFPYTRTHTLERRQYYTTMTHKFSYITAYNIQ